MTGVKTKIGIADIAVCLAAVMTAGILLLFPSDSVGNHVSVKTDGDIYRFSLSDDRTEHITSNGIDLTVMIEDGKVFISESDCPDKLCVKAGKTNSSTKPIVCVPAKVLISVEGDGDGGGSDADVIAGR